MQRLTTQLRVLGIILLVAASLFSAPQKPYSKHDKAFFLPDATVEFVRPGLTITINSAKIASDGTITVALYSDRSERVAARFSGCDIHRAPSV